MGSKICDSCRKKLAQLPDLGKILESPAQCESPLRDEPYLDVPAMNRCLTKIGETPLSKCESRNPKHVEDKIERITEAMMELFIDDTTVSNVRQDDESEIIL